jgi:hypothetical protein
LKSQEIDMAKKKKKAAKKAKAPKRAVKKLVRKAAAKRPAAKKAPARTAKKAKKKGFIARAVSEMAGLLKRKPARKSAKAKKTSANREFGEGNYKASKRFRTEQETFVKKNKAKIPAMGKAAEDALAGPEGDDLRAAEAAAAVGHSE